MKERVLEILKNVRADVDFENETQLINDEILDSFDIITIVQDLNEEFDVEISVEDLEPDNFNSVDAIVALIEKRQK